MKNPHISINQVSLSVGGRSILCDIDAQLSDRRIGIVGRNGSGKSTLARCLCGLIKPTSGKVILDDIDIYADRKQAIRKIGILFQNPDHQIIYPTVGEEIDFGLRQIGHTAAQARDATRQILTRFDTLNWLDRQTASLSQGQKQLLCLMSILAMEPDVIVLDEPYSGLDIPTRRILGDVFQSLPQTVIHITHDPEAIETYDQVLWLDAGRIQQIGSPSQVLPKFMDAMMIASGLT